MAAFRVMNSRTNFSRTLYEKLESWCPIFLHEVALDMIIMFSFPCELWRFEGRCPVNVMIS